MRLPSVIADAPVLRQAALGDVQVGHDLEARDHRQGQVLGRRRHLVERAVHAVADLELGLERLEMNVAGAVLDRLEQDQVHEADDRGLVGQARHHRRVVGDRHLADFLGDLLVRAQLLEDVGDALVLLGVELLDGLLDLRRVGHHQLDVLLDDEAQLVDAAGVQRVHQGDLQRGIRQAHRQALIHARRLGRDQSAAVRASSRARAA